MSQPMTASTQVSVLDHVQYCLPQCHYAHYETGQQSMPALQKCLKQKAALIVILYTCIQSLQH